MSTIRKIEKAREAILSEMKSIRSMRKGSLTEQFLKVRHKGKSDPVLRGPYFVFTRKEGKKTVGYRLRTEAEKEAVGQDVSAHKRFVDLCKQYVELTEKLGELEREASRTSPSSGTRK